MMTKTRELGVPEIIATLWGVTICGIVVMRPHSISAAQWLSFWERVAEIGREK